MTKLELIQALKDLPDNQTIVIETLSRIYTIDKVKPCYTHGEKGCNHDSWECECILVNDEKSEVYRNGINTPVIQLKLSDS